MDDSHTPQNPTPQSSSAQAGANPPLRPLGSGSPPSSTAVLKNIQRLADPSSADEDSESSSDLPLPKSTSSKSASLGLRTPAPRLPLNPSEKFNPEPHYPEVESSVQPALSEKGPSAAPSAPPRPAPPALAAASGSATKVSYQVMGRHTLVDKSTVREEQPSGSAKILHLPSSKQLEERRLARINYFNALLTLIYLCTLLLFMLTASLTFLWPEHLPRLGLNLDWAYQIMLGEIAILLLTGSMQATYSRLWRRASLIFSLITISEIFIIWYLS